MGVLVHIGIVDEAVVLSVAKHPMRSKVWTSPNSGHFCAFFGGCVSYVEECVAEAIEILDGNTVMAFG